MSSLERKKRPPIPLHKLLRFVPQMVVDLYSNSCKPLAKGPVYGKLTAATGFFDVSGFSKLGDKLNSQETTEHERFSKHCP